MGFSVEEFWRLTPYQFYRVVDGFNKRREYEHDTFAWMMYNNAALSQMGKKMPPFKKFTIKEMNRKGIDSEAIKARFTAYKKMYEASKCQ